MCNPPFYRDEQDIYDSQSSKTDLPAAACLGSENEMVTEGGEVQFVMRMIEESMDLKDAIRYVNVNGSWSSEATSLRGVPANLLWLNRWYTSMLGKRSSVDQIVAFLKEQKVQTRS